MDRCGPIIALTVVTVSCQDRVVRTYRVQKVPMADTGDAGAAQPGEPDVGPEEPAPTDQPSPYEYAGTDTERSYDQASLEQAVDDALAVVLQLNGGPAVEAYQTMLALADSDCPEASTEAGSTDWVGGCVTDDGVIFGGYGYHQILEDTDWVGDGMLMTGITVGGMSVIEDAAGNTMEFAGFAWDMVGWSEREGTTSWRTGVRGSFYWDDARAEAGWLGGEIRPHLDIIAAQHTHVLEGLVQSISVEGGVGGLPGTWGTVFFNDVRTFTVSPGFWECPEEPLGTLSVRDPSGYWYEVVFDGEEVDGRYVFEPGSCDGCGTVFSDGVSVGEACTDFSGLIGWTESPW